MAGWMTIVGSVMVVLTMYDGVANLRSLENQERVEEMLNDPPWDGTGLDVEQWLSIMQTLSMVAAACAAAAAILGWHVLQRNHAARIALSVVAVPLFFAGLVSGGFLTTLVVVAVVMMWTRPARDWFNGIPYTPPSPRPKAGADAPSGPPVHPPVHPPDYPPAQPPAYQPAEPPTGSTPAPTLPDHAAPSQGQPHVGFGMPQAARPAFTNIKPPALLRACLVTWVVAGATLLLCVLAFLVFAFSPDVVDQLREQNPQAVEDLQMRDDQVRLTLLVGMAVLGAWAATAVVLAVFVYRGHDWARILLIISAIASGLFALTGVTVVLPLVAVAASGVTVHLLLRRDVRDWFQRRI